MDRTTVLAYDKAADRFAADWLEQPAPTDLYALLLRYFVNGPTADIGCGAGRDTAWLSSQGYPTVGYDASAGLLAEARTHYPDLSFKPSSLPELAGIHASAFENVLCETVIMHLPTSEIAAAVRRLIDILRPGGTLFLSWRIPQDGSARDGNERLYSAFDKTLVLNECAGQDILVDDDAVNESSGKVVHRVVLRKRIERKVRP